jgi:hypothetical protein
MMVMMMKINVLMIMVSLSLSLSQISSQTIFPPQSGRIIKYHDVPFIYLCTKTELTQIPIDNSTVIM